MNIIFQNQKNGRWFTYLLPHIIYAEILIRGCGYWLRKDLTSFVDGTKIVTILFGYYNRRSVMEIIRKLSEVKTMPELDSMREEVAGCHRCSGHYGERIERKVRNNELPLV